MQMKLTTHKKAYGQIAMAANSLLISERGHLSCNLQNYQRPTFFYVRKGPFHEVGYQAQQDQQYTDLQGYQFSKGN